MYRDNALWNIAVSNGFKPTGNPTDDLIGIAAHLPVQILRTMQKRQPNHPIVDVFRRTVQDILHTSMESLDVLEQDRTLAAVYTDRIRTVLNPNPQGGDGQGQGDGQGEPQEGENDGEKSAPPNAPQLGRAGEGDGQSPPNAPPAPAPPNQAGAGEGDKGGANPPPQPQQGKSKGSPAKQPPSKAKQRTAEQLAKELNKGDREAAKMQTNTSSSGGSDTAAADRELTNRIRRVFDKITGSFAQVMTPRWDASKLSKRIIAHRNLHPARKEEDGRPKIAFWSDVSPSCEEMSLVATKAANSACMLGTLEAEIWSMPLNNWDYAIEDYNNLKYASYRNGKYVDHSLIYAFERNNNTSIVKTVQQRLDQMEMTVPQYIEHRGFDGNMRYAGVIAQALMLADEFKVPLSTHTKLIAPTMQNVPMSFEETDVLTALPPGGEERTLMLSLMDLSLTPLQDNVENIRARSQQFNDTMNTIIGKYPDLAKRLGNENSIKGWQRATDSKTGKYEITGSDASSALLTNMDADIIVYYTDTDGVWRTRSMLPLLKPHQRLFILTYASIPDTEDRQGRFAVKVPEHTQKMAQVASTHNTRGTYSRPPVRQIYDGKKTVNYGMSRPSFAFSPTGTFDLGFIPGWFGSVHDDRPNHINPWQLLAMSRNAHLVTIIPNVTDIDGYVKALEMVASPDRLNLAKQAGKGRIHEINENRHRWASKGNPLGNY